MKIELSGHYGYRRIVRTMLPSVAMMVVTSVYSIVDGFFISNFAGNTAFASMNVIWPFIAILSAFGLMLGSGGSALVSIALGQGDPERANRLFTTMTRVAVAAGIVLGALSFVFMRPIAVALGAEGEMVRYAVLYGRIVVSVMPLFIVQMAFQSFYMVAERPQLGTMMSVVCGVSNIALDAVFVAWFGWGLGGAAIATAFSIALGGIYPLVKFTSRRLNDTHIRFVRSSTDWSAVGRACINGSSEYVGNVAFSIIGICYNLQLMRFIGENGVSAYGIIMYVGFIFAAVFIGYNMGISQIISFNYGAGNRAELRSLLRKSLVLCLLGGAVMTLAAELLAPLIARLFVGYKPDLVELTVHATRIYMLSFLICGVNMFASAWFTALGNGIVSAVAAFTRTLVFEMASVFVLPALSGVDGIWMSVNVAEVMAFMLAVALILAFRQRYLSE